MDTAGMLIFHPIDSPPILGNLLFLLSGPDQYLVRVSLYLSEQSNPAHAHMQISLADIQNQPVFTSTLRYPTGTPILHQPAVRHWRR
jgi:hypothetical protein